MFTTGPRILGHDTFFPRLGIAFHIKFQAIVEHIKVIRAIAHEGIDSTLFVVILDASSLGDLLMDARMIGANPIQSMLILFMSMFFVSLLFGFDIWNVRLRFRSESFCGPDRGRIQWIITTPDRST